jgi:glycerol uptake facilitator-like aquaporin
MTPCHWTLFSFLSVSKKKMTPILAEFLGTLLLIGTISFIGTPLAIGASLAIAAYLLGPYSGGHFNPAVTLWAFLSNKVSSNRALMHVAGQCLAAVTVYALKVAM